ncbi:MAG: SdrD B-like domain-containing protein, partial [Chloroflexota bacterium]
AEMDAGGNLSNTVTADSTESSAATNTLNIPVTQTPSIKVEKSLASYTDNDFSSTITRGDNLWYQFVVTNTGNVTLSNVGVTDNTFAIPVTCLLTTLASSDSVVCTADTFHTITLTEANAGKVTNTATASGEFSAVPYTASDTLVTPVQLLPSAQVSGQVRDDSNGNGNLGDSDAGLANVKIELNNGVCTLGVNCPSTLTNTSGVFTFNGVANGSYMLVETDPPNYISTADSNPPNDNQINVIVLNGFSSTNNVFLDTANPASCSAPDPVNGFVVSTNPSNGATGVPMSTTNISVTFNQPVLTSGADSVYSSGKIELKNQANGKTVAITGVTYDPVTFTATLTFDASDPNWQAGTLYTITVKNVKNACGTAPPNVVRSFTTEVAISGQVRNSLDSQGIYGSTVQLTGGSCGASCGSTTTDQNGNFRFAGFAPGSYTLTQTDLPGYSSVSDSNPPNDNLIALTLTAGSNSTGHLFTDVSTCTGGVSFVVSTNPANGATGVSLGITTLTVTFNQPMITYGGGSILDVSNFNNAIDNLSLGGNVPILGIAYNPNTYTATLTIDTTDPQWQPGSQFRLRIKNSIKNACNVNPTGSDVDVLFTTAAYISGQVRNNLDSQGIYGVTVGLSGGSCGASCGTTITDINGNFLFSGFAPGNYTLTETDLPGYISISDSTGPNNNLVTLTVTAGSNSTGHFFIDSPSCTAGANFVASTNPVNGTTGVSLNTVTLTVTFNQPMITYGGGSVLNVGNFNSAIDNLTLGGNVPILGMSYNPNTYTATLTIDTSDPDWKPGSRYRLRIKNNVKNACNVSPSGADVDVLFTTNLVISGQVRNDIDGDGNLTDPDAGIASVTVRLYNSLNALVGTTATNAGGYFTFGNLSPGTYYVRETDPPGFASTADSFGANDNEITVTLTAGANSIGHKFLDAP